MAWNRLRSSCMAQAAEQGHHPPYACPACSRCFFPASSGWLAPRRVAAAAVNQRLASSSWLSTPVSSLRPESRVYSGAAGLPSECDIAVVGGGLVGAAFAATMATSPIASDLRILLIDRQTPTRPAAGNLSPLGPEMVPQASSTPGQGRSPLGPPDVRVSALSPSSIEMFKQVGAWDLIQQSSMGTFDSMQVWDTSGMGYVHFKAEEAGASTMGAVVENNVMLDALYRVLWACPNVDIISPASVTSLTLPSNSHSVDSSSFPTVGLPPLRRQDDASTTDTMGRLGLSVPDLEAGAGRDSSAQRGEAQDHQLRARLVVGADGKDSRVRHLARMRSAAKSYGQRAVVATVACAAPHTTAWQRYLPTGPIALLPMAGVYGNIVWSTSPDHAAWLSSLPSVDFVRAVNHAFHSPPQASPGFSPTAGPGAKRPLNLALDSLAATILPGWAKGASKLAEAAVAGLPRTSPFPSSSASSASFVPPPQVVEAIGAKRPSFPLTQAYSLQYTQPGLAMIGDAVHTMHPMAGQGVNLGYSDVWALARVLQQGLRDGRSLGEAALLAEYERGQVSRNQLMLRGVDALGHIFAPHSAPFTLARALGLSAVQQVTPLKVRFGC
eukprot:jgi/Mesvir1/13115/Mv06091-RA.2